MLPMLLFTLKFGCEMQGRKIIQPDKNVNHLITIKLKISNLKTVKSHECPEEIIFAPRIFCDVCNQISQSRLKKLTEWCDGVNIHGSLKIIPICPLFYYKNT